MLRISTNALNICMNLLKIVCQQNQVTFCKFDKFDKKFYNCQYEKKKILIWDAQSKK